MSDIDQAIIREYSGQDGYGTLPYFVGKQYGNGWLRNLTRMAFPFLKKAAGAIGNIAANTAEDMLNDENKTIGQTIKQNASREANRILKRRTATTINRRGGGKVRKRPRTNTIF